MSATPGNDGLRHSFFLVAAFLLTAVLGLAALARLDEGGDQPPDIEIVQRVQGPNTTIERVSTQAPSGTRLLSRCVGAGCSVAKFDEPLSATALGRLERAYRSGDQLSIVVAAPGEPGARARLTMRSAVLPLRVDDCVAQDGTTAVPCTSSGFTFSRAQAFVVVAVGAALLALVAVGLFLRRPRPSGRSDETAPPPFVRPAASTAAAEPLRPRRRPAAGPAPEPVPFRRAPEPVPRRPAPAPAPPHPEPAPTRPEPARRGADEQGLEWCAIVLISSGRRATFQVTVVEPQGRRRAVATSAAFRMPARGELSPRGKARSAHAQLVGQLESAGWTAVPGAGAWHETGFVRRREAGVPRGERALITFAAREDGKGQFDVQQLDDFGNRKPIAASEVFPTRRGTAPAADFEPARAAHVAMLERMAANGWLPLGATDGPWYEVRLDRRR